MAIPVEVLHDSAHRDEKGEKAREWLRKRNQLHGRVMMCSDMVFSLRPGKILPHLKDEFSDHDAVRALKAAEKELDDHDASYAPL